jgi:hypothetical protein
LGTIGEHASRFIVSILEHQIANHRTPVDGSGVLPMFEAAASYGRIESAALLEPLTTILRSDVLIFNYADERCQGELVRGGEDFRAGRRSRRSIFQVAPEGAREVWVGSRSRTGYGDGGPGCIRCYGEPLLCGRRKTENGVGALRCDHEFSAGGVPGSTVRVSGDAAGADCQHRRLLDSEKFSEFSRRAWTQQGIKRRD